MSGKNRLGSDSVTLYTQTSVTADKTIQQLAAT